MTHAIQKAEVDIKESWKEEFASLRAEIRALRDECFRTFATKTELAEMKADIIKWMFVFWVGNVAATAAIVFGMWKILR